MPVYKKKPKDYLYQKYHNTITTLRRNDLWVNAKKNLSSHDNAEHEEYLQESDGKYLTAINLLT